MSYAYQNRANRPWHRLLQRQLKRHLYKKATDLADLPEELVRFLAAVNEAYHQFDLDQAMLERSLELSSQELLEANGKLQQVVKTIEAQVQQRTEDLSQANAALEQTLQELQATQLQLIQQEKMSSLGQLVAGIAHEINNPTNFIYGNVIHAQDYMEGLLDLIRLYQTTYPQPTPAIQKLSQSIELDYLAADLPQLLASMHTGSERIREIVMSLRSFSRLDEATVKRVNLHEGLDSTLMLLQGRFQQRPDRSTIQVIKQYGALPLVECYAGQLNQVFMNVLANATDAIDERFGGQQTLADADEIPIIHIQTAVSAPGWVKITIMDNGLGMDKTVQDNVFNPFYTTKPVGQGTGLGLSISYQIICDRHQGNLICASTSGVGTTFAIEIPITQESSQSALKPPNPR
ncbi:MAG: ATP-binding protein [Cyanobacteria bacterium]|nr:ATP-binding protein [Cyanobacteriota bacterium]MDA0864924.1 ATP-binding protein [Cyanobacteriota bacterium]